jgi:hypothetical protein
MRRSSMKSNKKMILAMQLVAFFLVWCFSFASSTHAQEALPKPGEVIDKSNIQTYKHLFPEEIVGLFEDGWGGLMPPVSVKVAESKPVTIPKVYQEFSERNRGKYGLAEDGMISGGYDYLGFPFPGVTPEDKDFAAKIMWNYEYRYIADDYFENVDSYLKRKGEPVTRTSIFQEWIWFHNRMVDDPKPLYDTPENLYKCTFLGYIYPDVLKNQTILSYRYLDPKKPDDTFVYLPSMRRVLRGEAGQRSTPLAGALVAFDDFHNFDGRIQQFTYNFLGEKKVLALPHNDANQKRIAQLKEMTEIPWMGEDWEIQEVYIIDIISKDPKYPQSKKRLYMSKDNPEYIFYCIAWDRGGKLWKVWITGYSDFPLPNGDHSCYLTGQFGADVQLGTLAHLHYRNQKLNGNGMKYEDFTPSAQLRRSR